MQLHPAFPDPGICKTRPAFSTYWSCLVEENYGCPYKFGFGFEYLCKHPCNTDFSTQTDKTARSL